MDSFNRSLLSSIQKWMFRKNVIVLIGARQVGKTTLLENAFPQNDETLWLNADDSAVRQRLEEQTFESIKSVVGQYKIVIIDEVQRVRNAGVLLKLMVDNFKQTQFIATGSSSIGIGDQVFESLTGRQVTFHLYPLGLREMYPKLSDFELESKLPFHLVYGSYPDIVNQSSDAAFLLKNLSNNYLYQDVLAWNDIRKPEILDKLLNLLALQVTSEVSINELANALKIKSETVENYIELLEKAFVIFRLKAYSTNPRKEISKMSKIYFWDNGIRNSIIENFNELNLRNDVGALWENYIISERLKANSWNNSKAKSYFWRNYNQSEVDYLEVSNHKILAYELKWNTIKNHTISRAFMNQYSEAETEIITPRYFSEFVSLE